MHAQLSQHDTSLPIEITADNLEVLQQEQVATFTGNVDAVQGDLVLSADRLKVYYRGGGDQNAPAPGAASSIRRIEADGNVFLSSPDETAQGESGVYDVAAHTITLDGSVVVTRNQDVVRGDHLVLDLRSGRSRMTAAVTSAEGGKPGERVRATFTPQPAPGAQRGA
ncbi:MAG: lipopolysaccharide transport periplasmic protein LptA, partial [Geminicoccaceae bacterium]